MWETGKACTKASDCTTYPNSACDAGLCTKGAPIPGKKLAIAQLATRVLKLVKLDFTFYCRH